MGIYDSMHVEVKEQIKQVDFSPSTMWVLGTRLGSRHVYLQTYPARPTLSKL